MLQVERLPPRWQTLQPLILRLMPRGFKRPRLLTQRPHAISASKAACHGASRSGGKWAAACGSFRLITRTAWVKLKTSGSQPRGQAACAINGRTAKCTSSCPPQLLQQQVGRLAEQHCAVGSQVCLELIEHPLDLRALVVERRQFQRGRLGRTEDIGHQPAAGCQPAWARPGR